MTQWATHAWQPLKPEFEQDLSINRTHLYNSET